MPDQYTKVIHHSWGSRIVQSIIGVLLGIITFLGSFFVLYWNEGRVDLSKVAETAIEIQSDSKAPAEADSQLVSTSGELKINETLGDTYLKSGNYVAVRRISEMYAWDEAEHHETERNTGGSETKTITYTYSKVWTDHPEDSGYFEIQAGHENPVKSIEGQINRVNEGTIGEYKLNMQTISLPPFSPINLTPDTAIETADVKRVSERYLYKGKGTMESPQIGDVRISYEVVKPLSYSTVFGRLDLGQSRITTYKEDNAQLYRLFAEGREESIARLSSEHNLTTWLLRLGGFLLMWIGLMLILKPLSVILDVLPFLGSISRFGVGLATFLVSLALSIVTIMISMILHSLIAVVLAAVAILIAAFVIIKNKKEAQPITQ